MNVINTNLLATLNKLSSKGDAIVVAGATDSGKSTAIGFTAKDDAVRDLLSMRESSGKGSTVETNIVVTDADDIPIDKLIIQVNMVKHHIANCSTDENKLLGKILHKSIRACENNPDPEIFEQTIRKTLDIETIAPANDSLEYKIKDFSSNEIDELVNALIAFPREGLNVVLNEAKFIAEISSGTKNKSRAEEKEFPKILSEKQDLQDYINNFWNVIVRILESHKESFIKMLEDAGAVVLGEYDGFIISLGANDYDSKIANLLLKSENGSKEYMFESMLLVFRGNDEYFNSPLSKYLVVSEQNGKEIHCLRFIDTMGLFHSTGAILLDEVERMIDLVSRYHSDKLVLVINSNVTDTVKDGYSAIMAMLERLKRSIDIHLIFTHWDEYLKDIANKENVCNRRSRNADPIDWDAIFNKALSEQTLLIDMFNKCIQSSGSKKMPCIVGSYHASLMLYDGSRLETVLQNNCIDYEHTLLKLVNNILESINKKGPKFKVLEGFAKGCTVIPYNVIMDVRKLYRNLVVDCKGKKYWASSVRAVNNKWCREGRKHDSDIKENEYNYENIHSTFVEDMSNLAMGILNNSKCININIESYITNADEKAIIEKSLEEYLKEGSYLGKEFAKNLGMMAYKNGFLKNAGFCYQYARLNDMFQYTQDYFFTGEKFVVSGSDEKNAVEVLQWTLQKCVRKFVDAKCIEVY